MGPPVSRDVSFLFAASLPPGEVAASSAGSAGVFLFDAHLHGGHWHSCLELLVTPGPYYDPAGGPAAGSYRHHPGLSVLRTQVSLLPAIIHAAWCSVRGRTYVRHSNPGVLGAEFALFQTIVHPDGVLLQPWWAHCLRKTSTVPDRICWKTYPAFLLPSSTPNDACLLHSWRAHRLVFLTSAIPAVACLRQNSAFLLPPSAPNEGVVVQP